MRRFRVRVNDEVFEVEVEEIGGKPVVQEVRQAAPSAPAVPSVPAAPSVPAVTEKPKKTEKPATATVSAEGKGSVTAPIPGTITSVKVKAGQQVKRGDVLLLLEAMKMQNEILAPYDAVVVEVTVSEGASVQTGDLLVKLDR